MFLVVRVRLFGKKKLPLRSTVTVAAVQGKGSGGG